MPLLSLATDAERLRPQRTPFHFNKARKKTPFLHQVKGMHNHRHDSTTTKNNDKVLFKLGNMKNSTQGAQLDWKTLTLYQTNEEARCPKMCQKIHAKILSVTSNHSCKEGCTNPPSPVIQYYTPFLFFPPIPNILQVTLPVTLLKGFSGLTVSRKTTKKDEFWGREKEIWSLILNWLKFQKGLVLQAAPACVVCV